MLLCYLCVTNKLSSQEWMENVKDNSNFYEIQKSFNEYWQNKEYQKGQGIKPYKRWENFWEPRVYPSGKFPKAIEQYKSYLKFLNESKKDKFQAIETPWKEVGPTVVPKNRLYYKSSGVGRINVIKLHPKNDNEIWIGAASGGAWRTTDKGKTWKQMGFTDILSMGVSDIAISESNPDIIYVATGDDNGYFQEDVYSVGIMKSTDGGNSWSIIGFEGKINDFLIAGRILIHPSNPDIVYVATSRGIFKTIDGGENWVNKSNGFFREMEFKTDDPNVIFAVTSGKRMWNGEAAFYKSIDAGETWKKVFQNSSVNRFEIGVTYKNPAYVYILGAKSNSGSYAGVWRSTNAGDSFEQMSSSPNILGINADGSSTSGQGYYDLAIDVSPVNEKQVYIGGIHIWKSNDEGRTWELINHWTGGYNKPYVHADQHFLTINPRTLELYSSNDGGLYLSSNNGISWDDLSSGLGISQFYKIGIANSLEEIISGGTQDNGTHLLSGGDWFHVNGGDGMQTEINSVDPNFIFCTSQYGSLFRSTNGGQNFSRVLGPDYFQSENAEWVTPFVLNPQNQKSIYIGYKDLYKSTNNGKNWAKISNLALPSPIDQIAISPSDSNIIYFTQSSAIYVTYNGGSTWQTIGSTSNVIKGLAVDYDDPNRFWVTLSGYNSNEKVFEYYGKNRTNITYNLPNVSTNTVAVVKNSSGQLIVGTDVGVMIKNPTDNFWSIFGKDLPPVIITDLKINYTNGKLYAASFGRGIWSNDIFSCNISSPSISVLGETSFCYGDSVTLTLDGDYPHFIWSNGDTNRTTTIKQTGSYYATVSDIDGCSARSEVVDVEVLAVPSFIINAENKGFICGEDTLQLSLPLGLTNYLWSNGETSNKIFVNKPGKYFATAFASNGCYLVSNVVDVIRGEFPEKPIIYQDDKYLVTDSGYTYRWYFNDFPVINSDTNRLLINDNGLYRVEIFNEYNCSAISDSYNAISSVEILNETSNIHITPNPTDGILTIKMSDLKGEVIVRLHDINGKELFSEQLTVNMDLVKNIDLSSMSSGAYILKIQNVGKVYQKLIIKK